MWGDLLTSLMPESNLTQILYYFEMSFGVQVVAFESVADQLYILVFILHECQCFYCVRIKRLLQAPKLERCV